jgi:hypothetical protein
MPDNELLRVYEDENGQLHANWTFDNKHAQYRLLGGLLGALVDAETEEVIKKESGSGLIVPPSGLTLPGGH